MRVSRPAFENETIITVVALDDCTLQVIRNPETIPVKRFRVNMANMPRSRFPATFCKPELMMRIP